MKYLLTMTFYCLCACVLATDYTGNQLVAVLGKSVSSPEFLQYKNFWLLNSRFENPDGGIKVVVNPNTLLVDTILVAGYDYAPSYTNCSSKLPYNIQLNDNVSAISQKTGVAPTHYGGTVGYDVREYKIMVKYNTGSNINCMHFVNANAKPYSIAPKLNVTIPEGASQMDVARINFEAASVANNSSTTIAKPVSTAVQPVTSNGKLEATRRALEDATFNTTTGTKISAPVTTSAAKPSTTSTGSTAAKPVTTTSTTSSSSSATVTKPATTSSTTTVIKTGSTTTTTVVKSTPSFKTGILAVFNAWRESGFYSIKNTQRTNSNVWNYKYTYATKLRIPGEQYNMLYSFPFESSQMDFVSVLKESDSFDGFETAYKEYERKLMDSFPKSEGWIGTCLPNYDKSKISDFEIRNDKYGSVILDYCQTPKGKHILYLRFLLYS